MIMGRLVVVLLFLAHVNHARRVQSDGVMLKEPINLAHAKADADSFQALSQLLLVMPAAGRSASTRSSTPCCEMIRLDKLLAERGAGSRKDVDRFIRKGLVSIDGEVVPKNGAKTKVPWESSPLVDGFDYPPPPLLVAYHKPSGTMGGAFEDRDPVKVLPDEWHKLFHQVGSLSADTTGLILFSRDGTLTNHLLHVRYGVMSEYMAQVENAINATRVEGLLSDGILGSKDPDDILLQGVLLEVDNTEQMIRFRARSSPRAIRQALDSIGHNVIALKRMGIGEVSLNDLGLEEDEYIEVEGDALQWATNLKPNLTRTPRRKPRTDEVDEASRPSSYQDIFEREDLGEFAKKYKTEIGWITEDCKCDAYHAAVVLHKFDDGRDQADMYTAAVEEIGFVGFIED